MELEHHGLEQKSLRKAVGGTADWGDLAKECVLLIGIEDGEEEPPSDQRIPKSLPQQVYKRITELTVNVAPLLPTTLRAPNGGEYLRVAVPPASGVACTTDGRYYARLADTCKPVPPEDLMRLVAEKSAFVWELQPTDVALADADPEKRRWLLDALRASERVKPQVREKADEELIAHYDLCRGDRLTHVGVLWIGRREHRAALRHAPIIQFLRYDERERRIEKEVFGDAYDLSPGALLEAVRTMPVWAEGVEIPEGLFRERVPNYDVEAVRELVANALVHRVYTIRGDIYLNLYPDRLEVHSPGPLPGGVTPQNILHARVRRNEQLARLFHDLKLMEGEGTGYDRIYDILLSSGKPVPVVTEETDRVEVAVFGRDLDLQALRVAAQAASTYPLTERERITLGLLARHGPLTAAELARPLSLREARSVHDWLGALVERKLVIAGGRKRGRRYRANPRLLRDSGYRSRTTLVDIEDHRLRELIRTDVEHYPGSAISEIIERIGREIPKSRVQRHLQALRVSGDIIMSGSRRGSRYSPVRREARHREARHNAS